MNNGRKVTGGKYHALRKTKLFERSGQTRIVAIGETKRKILKVTGGNNKPILLMEKYVNVVNDGKSQRAEITNVEETPRIDSLPDKIF